MLHLEKMQSCLLIDASQPLLSPERAWEAHDSLQAARANLAEQQDNHVLVLTNKLYGANHSPGIAHASLRTQTCNLTTHLRGPCPLSLRQRSSPTRSYTPRSDQATMNVRHTDTFRVNLCSCNESLLTDKTNAPERSRRPTHVSDFAGPQLEECIRNVVGWQSVPRPYTANSSHHTAKCAT